MGTTCGCSNLNETNAPHSMTPREKQPSTRRQSNKKFQDINPQQQLYMFLSEHDLNLFKNEISERLNQYQQKNGIISKRLPFQNENFTSRNEIYIQLQQKINMRFTLKQTQTALISQDLLAIQDQNIKCQINEQLSQSHQESENEDSSNKSCLLSQQTHILNASLFTERAQATQIFYSQFKYFGQVELLQWDQKYRRSYYIYEGQLNRLILQNVESKYIVLLQSIQKYQQNQGIHLLAFSNQPKGVKLHFNGKKRLFPMNFSQNQMPSLAQLYANVRQFVQKAQFTDLTYFLTGWIPEILSMSEISNFKGVFQRLSSNMQQGNTLISFSRKNEKNEFDYVSLSELNISSALIAFTIGNKNLNVPDCLIYQKRRSNQLVMTFQNFIEIFDTIHINWNPVIYETIVKRQGVIKQTTERENKFLLVIPPSSQDIQVRLFIQKHHKCNQNEHSQQKLIIKLFQFQEPASKDIEAIRTVQVQNNICSDVFIFQTCKEKTKYLLNIKTQQDIQLTKDLYYSVTMLSFVQMYFDELKQTPVMKQISYSTIIDPKNIGYGINSPYFDKNLQFTIQTEKEKDLRIEVRASNQMKYEICLIPDQKGDKNLSKINLQSIINNSEVSSLKKGLGNYTIRARQSNYLLVLNCFQAIKQNIQIIIQLCGKQPKSQNFLLTINEIHSQNTIIFLQEIKWLPNHSGPRKRLKSNSNSDYQPSQVFSQFFKNPIIDKFMPKGKYQFFIKSQTFKDYFDSVQSYEDRNTCEPPPLSIAVLQIKKQKKEYRIISDDALYIPFGIGYWSQEILLQEGNYRFVCPKIQKSYAVGTFGVVKC